MKLRTGLGSWAPVAVDVLGAPIGRFPFEDISSIRGNSSCVSELSSRWMTLRFCASRAFPLPLDLVARDLESGISTDSSVSLFDGVRYGGTHPGSNKRLHLTASHFVAERILPVLCLGPFYFFLIHSAQCPRSVENEIF